jgi:hypothetical protein
MVLELVEDLEEAHIRFGLVVVRMVERIRCGD